jgi:leucyl-tRNA synthetase
MKELDFKLIEKKWQDKWAKEKIFEVNENNKKEKFYLLEMFPYPSASGLHMGHAWNYTIGDVFARFKLMQGFNVLHPMGYDALGLPAENAAIQVGEHPKDYTDKSVKNYIKQQKQLGISYDWSRVLSSANPNYYKWDQWIFLKMLERGLAYQKESSVNWCPKCNTVLANEQVENGHCWRHDDTKVEIKYLKQWFLKITDYADELYEKIDDLDWPEKTKAMQKNWIGKSFGHEILFEINGKKWPIFTTRLDTIFGVSFMVVSAQHTKLMDLVSEEQKDKVKDFVNKLGSVSEKDLADMDKQGVFTGSYAINPINKKKVPIYAGNFVVADYGSGMIMAVPAHDKRDYDFAKKYELEILPVIVPKDPLLRIYNNQDEEILTEKGRLINSSVYSGLTSEEAVEKIFEELSKDKLIKKKINFRLRDWGISRQRYWGTPIPVVYCNKCGVVGVKKEDLPIELPYDVKFGDGNPLKTNENWINTTCPMCGGIARRETDTMDTFVNSSWYFLRYCDSNNEKNIFDKSKVNYWCPIDLYIGGAEHACMHLIYFRFYTKFLRDLGLLNFDEPAKRLFHQGMLHGEDGQRMSKSKGNGILPEVVSDIYGIDTARFFLCSLASPDKNIDWSEKGILGSMRFINKLFNFYNSVKIGNQDSSLNIKFNKLIKDCTNYLENLEYRKAIIELREFFNEMNNKQILSKEVLEGYLKLLNPFCPHLTEELWEKLGHNDFISNSIWPNFNFNQVDEGKKIDLNEKIFENISRIIFKLKESQKINCVYLYVLPFEVDKLNIEFFKEKIGCDVKIYSVKDADKYDPKDMAKKAKPMMPGLYIE